MAGSTYERLQQGALRITEKVKSGVIWYIYGPYGKIENEKYVPGSTLSRPLMDALNEDSKDKPLGYLRKEHLESLIRNGFIDPAIYLIIKAFHNKPKIQRELLESIVDTTLTKQGDSEAIRETLLKGVSGIEDTVQSGKLFQQVNRQGTDYWNQHYRALARKLFEEGKTPVLNGYGTSFGLRDFIDRFRDRDHQEQDTQHPSIQILIPKALCDPNIAYAGYNIYLGNPLNQRVKLISKAGYKTPENSFLIDDTGEGVVDGKIKGDLGITWHFMHGSKPLDLKKTTEAKLIVTYIHGSDPVTKLSII